MSSIISTIVAFSLLGSSFCLQDDPQRTILQNDASFQNQQSQVSSYQNQVSFHNHPNQVSYQNQQNQEYYVQQRPAAAQNYPQHYVPVPIQLLQRSVYTQQPQAALIIMKAFPVYLTPSQAANLQSQSSPVHQDFNSRIPNFHMIHYSQAPSPPVYSTAQPSLAYPTAQPAPERPAVSAVSTQQSRANNYVSATNPGLYFASPSNTQGDNYLNQLAQVVAQQYSKSPSNYKAPAIIAGLENFSPEQQNQIKNHLKNYITSHAEAEKQDREISVSNDAQEKYSSKIASNQYPQQSDWRPAQQPTHSNSKN